MPDNQTLKPLLEIEKFKKQFLKEYNQHLYIYSISPNQKRTDINLIKGAAWHALIENHPEFTELKSFDARCRRKEYILYMQVMCFVARNQGYSFNYIGSCIGNRTHATILNCVRKIENHVFTGDYDCNVAMLNINEKLEKYVGTILKNNKSEDKSKSSSDPIWDEARRFLAQSKSSR